jgi:hypothetical protein
MTDKKKAKNRSKEELAEISKAYRSVLAGPSGKIVRKDLEYTVNMTCHVPGDPHTSAFNEGKRIMARNFLLLGEADEN